MLGTFHVSLQLRPGIRFAATRKELKRSGKKRTFALDLESLTSHLRPILSQLDAAEIHGVPKKNRYSHERRCSGSGDAAVGLIPSSETVLGASRSSGAASSSGTRWTNP